MAKPAVVLIDADEWESIVETLYWSEPVGIFLCSWQEPLLLTTPPQPVLRQQEHFQLLSPFAEQILMLE
jgi:hypothetical protein